MRLVFVAYGQLAWSFLLTVEIRFGLFAYGGKSVWSFLLTVPPCPEIGFGLFLLTVPPRPEIFCLRLPHRKSETALQNKLKVAILKGVFNFGGCF